MSICCLADARASSAERSTRCAVLLLSAALGYTPCPFSCPCEGLCIDLFHSLWLRCMWHLVARFLSRSRGSVRGWTLATRVRLLAKSQLSDARAAELVSKVSRRLAF